MVPKRRSRLPIVGLVTSIVLGCSVLAASSASPAYQPPKDYAMEWAGRLSLLGVIGAAALIAYVLILRRRHLTAAPSQWMLFIGICILPLPVMMLGSAVGLERAKDVSFCQHCHVMRQFVNDMENPESNQLAALHFKNRYIQRSHCYVCHTDYGLFGTMQAKLAGVGHIWKEATGSFTMPVRIARPYRFTICLDCHGQSAKFNTVREHDGLVAKIVGGEATCTSCHGLSHLPREQRGVQP